jgi:hypothetical protein
MQVQFLTDQSSFEIKHKTLSSLLLQNYTHNAYRDIDQVCFNSFHFLMAQIFDQKNISLFL